MSTLILVFNAAAGCPTMVPLFEEHTLRHYSYLKTPSQLGKKEYTRYNPKPMWCVVYIGLCTEFRPKLLQQTFVLQHQFLGLERAEEGSLRQLRLRALALQLVVVIRGSNASALGLCEAFIEQLENLQGSWRSTTCSQMHSRLPCFARWTHWRSPSQELWRVLQPLLQAHACPTLRFCSAQTGAQPNAGLERIKQTRAVLYEPAGETDLPQKFTAGLVLAITLDAEIESVQDIRNVRVKVRYPDKQVQLILPRLADFRQLEDLKYRLYTTVLLSHGVWSAHKERLSSIWDSIEKLAASSERRHSSKTANIEEFSAVPSRVNLHCACSAVMQPFPDKGRPVYNLAMDGLVIVFTGFKSRTELCELLLLSHYMGASVRDKFSSRNVTHCVADSVTSAKYELCDALDIPIMKKEWLLEAWAHRDEKDFSVTSESMMKLRLEAFRGLQLAFLGFADDERQHMEEVALANEILWLNLGLGLGCRGSRGGANAGCHFLVVDDSNPVAPVVPSDISPKVQVVKSEWFWASIQHARCFMAGAYIMSTRRVIEKKPESLLHTCGTLTIYLQFGPLKSLSC
ncbi:hypothetical protein HPB49_026163 [Dermacentor silvarum]|nr:hypothetical protein HPB49_026163 [Dermacentor silvarum]